MIPELNHGGNNNLIETPKIKAENINLNAYFLSLTDIALEAGLLTDKDMDDIQSQIYDILSDNIWMCTNGTSTSVKSTEANEMVLEILYVLDCFCRTEAGEIPNENKLPSLIKLFKEKAGIKNCYQKGLEFIKQTGKPSFKEIEAAEISKSFDFNEFVDINELADFEKKQSEHDIKNKIISQSVMTDEDFNYLYNKILKCKTAEKKAALIIETVSSAADFLDILNAQCLFGDEYHILYKKLSEDSPETIEFLMNNADNGEDEWQEYLIKFINHQ